MSDEVSVKSLFQDAVTEYNAVENFDGPSNDKKLQERIKRLLDKLNVVHRQARALDFISPGETLDDIATHALKYLLIDAYAGDLYTKLSDMDSRLVNLTEAEAHLLTFLEDCYRHEIMQNPVDREQYKTLLAKLSPETTTLREAAPKSVQQLREEKIAKYKRDKELKNKLAELGELVSAANDQDDEELYREYYLTLLDQFIQKSMDTISLTMEEKKLLEHRAKMMRENPSQASAPPPSKNPNPPLKPIVIKDTRSIMQSGVFRPGWRQPTMTLDEYLEIERQRGNILTGGGPEQERHLQKEKEGKLYRDSDADADAETEKLRRQDEFNDDHQRGSGNRYNRS